MVLSELPLDALSSILSWLDARDLAALGMTCRRLAEVSGQEALWVQHCAQWLARQPSAAGLGGVGVEDVQEALGLGTKKLLYESLHKLGAWPVGVWYASRYEGCYRPWGQILVVEQSGGVFTGSMVSTGGGVPGPNVDQSTVWEFDEFFTAVVAVEEHGKPKVNLEWQFPGDGGNSLSIAQDGNELVCFQGFSEDEILSLPSSRLLQDASGGISALDKHVLPFCRLPMKPAVSPRAQVAAEPAETNIGEGIVDGAALLRRLEGVYTACYGPHGMEVLQLSMAGPQDPPPPRCHIAGTRLEARKITGDPNVPAHEISFVVDAAQHRMGPYDPHQDDPFPQPGGLARPVLSFFQQATVMVHLEDRPAVAWFRGEGQINHVPGFWDPEFVAVTVVVYEEGYRLPFTVIFEDEGIQVRHAMDFQAFTIPLPAFDKGSPIEPPSP